MSKNLQHMDDIFKKAYEEFGDDPAPEVWDKINAGLDKKDAVAFRKTSRNWKRVAILLILVLTGFIIYESGIVKVTNIQSKENVVETSQGKKIDKDVVKKDETLRQNQLPGDRTNDREAIVATKKPEAKSENNSGLTVNPEKNVARYLPGHRNNRPRIINERVKRSAQNTRDGEVIMIPALDESQKEVPKNNQYLAKEVIIPPVEKVYPGQWTLRPLNNIPLFPLNNINELQSSAVTSKGKPGANIGGRQTYWAISGYFSSDHPGYRLDKDQPTIVKIKAHEEHKPSFSGGILVTRQFNKRFGLQTGLIYSNIAIAISPQKIYASQNQTGNVSYKYVTSSGYAYIKPAFASSPSPGDSLTAEAAQHSLHYLITPLIIRYRSLSTRKLTFSPGLGIAGNFLTSAKLETEVTGPFNREHVLINKLKGIRPFNWSVIADMAMEYFVNGRTSLNLRPSFNYALSPITSDNDVDTFPYNFGVGIGVTYRF